jgi:hypothetical protein
MIPKESAEPAVSILSAKRTASECRLRGRRQMVQARPVTAAFIPGVELARLYYVEAVGPLLREEFPHWRYTAALIGPGSEVLGFDSPRSTDHDWGPRLQVFLADADEEQGQAEHIRQVLADRLPPAFRGWPTVFRASGAGADEPPSHWVTVAGLRSWLTRNLGFDPSVPVSLLDWLATPSQVLAEVTGGEVFHDGLGDGGLGDGGLGDGGGVGDGLAGVRNRLAWYPHDVWLHVMACQWQRIVEEEPFPGRCAGAGDDLGSSVVTARLVRDLMRLALLMQRRYPPYSKWLGSGLAQTAAAAELLPPMTAALRASTWTEREDHLSASCEAVARLHNTLAVTPPLDPAVRPTYYDRPYRVLDSGRFAQALRAQIRDDEVRALPLTGAVDQFVDSTTAIGDQSLLRAAVAAQTR